MSILSRNVLIVVAIAIVAVLAAVFLLRTEPTPEPAGENTPEVTPQEPQAFDWRFETADTLNPDGGARTEVFLDITYDDDSTEERRIDTVDGGCSVLPSEPGEGDFADAERVQCYYAGLGQRYRITEDDAAYRVERLMFEEALPDVPSPSYEWEVVGEVSFSS